MYSLSYTFIYSHNEQEKLPLRGRNVEHNPDHEFMSHFSFLVIDNMQIILININPTFNSIPFTQEKVNMEIFASCSQLDKPF